MLRAAKASEAARKKRLETLSLRRVGERVIGVKEIVDKLAGPIGTNHGAMIKVIDNPVEADKVVERLVNTSPYNIELDAGEANFWKSNLWKMKWTTMVKERRSLRVLVTLPEFDKRVGRSTLNFFDLDVDGDPSFLWIRFDTCLALCTHDEVVWVASYEDMEAVAAIDDGASPLPVLPCLIRANQCAEVDLCITDLFERSEEETGILGGFTTATGPSEPALDGSHDTPAGSCSYGLHEAWAMNVGGLASAGANREREDVGSISSAKRSSKVARLDEEGDDEDNHGSTGQFLTCAVDGEGNQFLRKTVTRGEVSKNLSQSIKLRRLLVTERSEEYLLPDGKLEPRELAATLTRISDDSSYVHVARHRATLTAYSQPKNPRDALKHLVVFADMSLFTKFLNSEYTGVKYHDGLCLWHFLPQGRHDALVRQYREAINPLETQACWLDSTTFWTMFDNLVKSINCIFGVETREFHARVRERLESGHPRPSEWPEVWRAIVEGALGSFTNDMRASNWRAETPVVEHDIVRHSKTPGDVLSHLADLICIRADRFAQDGGIFSVQAAQNHMGTVEWLAPAAKGTAAERRAPKAREAREPRESKYLRDPKVEGRSEETTERKKDKVCGIALMHLLGVKKEDGSATTECTRPVCSFLHLKRTSELKSDWKMRAAYAFVNGNSSLVQSPRVREALMEAITEASKKA
jgi:hypothetical protein